MDEPDRMVVRARRKPVVVNLIEVVVVFGGELGGELLDCGPRGNG